MPITESIQAHTIKFFFFLNCTEINSFQTKNAFKIKSHVHLHLLSVNMLSLVHSHLNFSMLFPGISSLPKPLNATPS